MGDVVFVPDQQLEGVHTRFEVKRRFRLAHTEVDMVFVGRDGHVHRG